MIEPTLLLNEIIAELARAITGKLFTEKRIRAITSSAVGKHFTDLFPVSQKNVEVKDRVEEARQYISKASTIIFDIQHDLENQSQQLGEILRDVQEKRDLAVRYEILATINREKLSAFREEIEETLRRELLAQAESGKRLRQIISLALWFLTLILGAGLGAYFKDIVSWIKAP